MIHIQLPPVCIDVKDQTLWGCTFGSGFETFSWWNAVRFVEGDWDQIGKAELEIEDPDDPMGMPLMFTVRIDDLEQGFREVIETEVWADSFTNPENWDAGDADAVLQTIVFGTVVYG